MSKLTLQCPRCNGVFDANEAVIHAATCIGKIKKQISRIEIRIELDYASNSKNVMVDFDAQGSDSVKEVFLMLKTINLNQGDHLIFPTDKIMKIQDWKIWRDFLSEAEGLRINNSVVQKGKMFKIG